MTTRVIRLTGGEPLVLTKKMKINADFNWTIRVREDDGVTPKVTTGWKMNIPIKDGRNGSTYTTLSTEGAGAAITHTPAVGLFSIHVTAATVNAYKFQRAVYDVILENSTGDKTVPITGDVEVIP